MVDLPGDPEASHSMTHQFQSSSRIRPNIGQVLRSTLLSGLSNAYSILTIAVFTLCFTMWTAFHVKQAEENAEISAVENTDDLPISIIVLAMTMMSLNVLQFQKNVALR